MEAKILSGREIASKIEGPLRKQAQLQRKRLGRSPCLMTVVVGGDGASKVYLASQAKLAGRLGIKFESLNLPEGITQSDLEKEIQNLNKNDKVDAVLIQLPLPKSIDAQEAISILDPHKDAEGLHPENLGKLFFAEPKIVPPTVASVMAILEETKIDLYGKEMVVVGHSEIVGKPLSLLLLNKFATTTICHIGTSEAGQLESHLARAEVLIVAVGKAEFIKGPSLKEGVVVIDVGINRKEGKLVGDLDFETAKEKASFITPVPGGVGSLTVVMLMKNVLTLCSQKR